VTSGPIAGDFNDDGLIDSADYILWRKNFGAPFTETDYDAWRKNFSDSDSGSTASLATSGAASNGWPVPEPHAQLLLATLATFALISRRSYNIASRNPRTRERSLVRTTDDLSASQVNRGLVARGSYLPGSAGGFRS
jgi:hypothetical protein